MKLIFSFLALAICMAFAPVSDAQLLEMAANCDQAIKKLTEITKSENGKTGQQIKEAMGVDVLMECDTLEGKVTCFQCLDDQKELKLIQVVRNKATGAFEKPVYGCRCRNQQ